MVLEIDIEFIFEQFPQNTLFLINVFIPIIEVLTEHLQESLAINLYFP
jgi:hypothetical protein